MTTMTVLIVLALLATFATLAWGLASMAQGGTYDKEHSEKLMFARVGLQLFAFVLLLVALAVSVV